MSNARLGTLVRKLAFGEVATIDSGLVSPKAAAYKHLPHVGPENIESESGRIVGVRTAAEIGLRSGKHVFDDNAIVYSKIRPNLNKVCIPGFKGLSSADCYVVRAREEVIDRGYLLMLMRSPHFVKQAVKVSARTGMPKINRPDLLRMKVLVPDLASQRRVASLGVQFDRAEESIHALVNAYQRMKAGLMQQLLCPATASTGANGWQRHLLRELFSQRTEANRPDLPLLSVTSGQGVVPRDRLERRDSSNPDKSLYLRVAPGDIVYNTMRMWQGVSARSTLEGIVSPAYTVCVPNEKVDGEFAAVLFKYPPIVHLFRRHSQGLVDDTLNLKFDHFARIAVRIPDMEQQRRIAAVFRAIDREIQLLGQLADALSRQKRAILDKLLSGELRLPET